MAAEAKSTAPNAYHVTELENHASGMLRLRANAAWVAGEIRLK